MTCPANFKCANYNWLNNVWELSKLPQWLRIPKILPKGYSFPPGQDFRKVLNPFQVWWSAPRSPKPHDSTREHRQTTTWHGVPTPPQEQAYITVEREGTLFWINLFIGHVITGCLQTYNLAKWTVFLDITNNRHSSKMLGYGS